MKIIKYLSFIILLALTAVCSSCNDDLEDELFIKNTYLVKNGWQEYKIKILEDNTAILPISMGVSGTSDNDKDIVVVLAADPDTLAGYNFEKFKQQTDYYYKELPQNYYAFDQESYIIPKKENKVQAIITIDLDKIENIYEEYVLPLQIKSSEGEDIAVDKYSKLLARVEFTNRFSGSYGGEGVVKQDGTSYEDKVQGVKLNGTATNSCCFYAGNITRTTHADFMKYMIDITTESDGTLILSSKNTNLGLVPERATITRKYVKHSTDNRYYIETSVLSLKYQYKDQEEGFTCTYEGNLTKVENVLVKDYPGVTVEEE